MILDERDRAELAAIVEAAVRRALDATVRPPTAPVTIAAAAEHFTCSGAFLRRAIRDGRLKALEVGKRGYRVALADVGQLLARDTTAATFDPKRHADELLARRRRGGAR